ncbi:MAG: hypothetical protein ACP5G7_03130 [Anaerolineae bacterium]
MEKKFRALRIVSVVFKVLAWVALVGGILSALIAVVIGALSAGAMARMPQLRNLAPLIAGGGGIVAAVVSALGILVSSLVGFVLLYAYAEAVYLAIAIEQNTRECAYYLKGESAYQSTPDGYGA